MRQRPKTRTKPIARRLEIGTVPDFNQRQNPGPTQDAEQFAQALGIEDGQRSAIEHTLGLQPGRAGSAVIKGNAAVHVEGQTLHRHTTSRGLQVQNYGPVNGTQILTALTMLEAHNIQPVLSYMLRKGEIITDMQPFRINEEGDMLLLHTNEGHPISAIWIDDRGLPKEVSFNKKIPGAKAMRPLLTNTKCYLGQEASSTEGFYNEHVAERQIGIEICTDERTHIILEHVESTRITKYKIPKEIMEFIGSRKN